MTRAALALAATVALAAFASEAAARPVPRPAAVLGVASRSGPSAYDGLVAFLSAMPVAVPADLDGGMFQMLAQAVGAHELVGVDRTKPAYLVYIDDGATRGLVAVARVSDGTRLAARAGAVEIVTRDGWAAIGAKEAVALVAPYALSTLVATPPPAGIAATIYVPAVLARYRDQLEQARNAASSLDTFGQAVTSYFDSLVSVVQEIDEIRVTLDMNADHAAVEIACVPHARSRLATFVAQQQASTFAMLSMLPDDPVAIAGHLVLGPYRDGLLDLMMQSYGAAGGADLLAAVAGVMKASAGEFAMSASFARGVEAVQLIALSDPAAARRSFAKLFEALTGGRKVPMYGIDQTFSLLPEVVEQDGVAIRAIEETVDLNMVPAKLRASFEQRMPGGKARMDVGTIDKLAVIASGAANGDRAKRLVESVRTKNAWHPSADIAALLERARQHKDSVAAVIDISRIPNALHIAGSAPVAFTFGVAAKTARIRIDAPITAARALSGH